jgi:hypothetical protein
MAQHSAQLGSLTNQMRTYRFTQANVSAGAKAVLIVETAQ